MYNPRVVFIAACLGMLIFGIVMAVLGAVLPSLIQVYGLSSANAGSLFTLMTFGMLTGSLIFGPLVDRFGYKWILVISTGLVFLGFMGLAMAPDMSLLVASLMLIGFGGGVINGGTNALVSDISTGSRGSGLSYLGVFFGIGAFGVPFVLGSLLALFTYQAIVASIGALFLLPMLFFAVLSYPLPKHAQGFPVAEALRLTRQKTLLLFGFILFLQSGLEMTVGGWTATFLHEVIGVGAQRAVLYLSFFWLGMMVARIVLGEALKIFSSAKVLYTSLLISLAGTLTLLLSAVPASALIGIILIGVGFAAVFPVILGLVGDAYAKLSGTAFSVVLAIGLVGGMTIPWMTGIVAGHVGLRLALSVILFGLAGIFILFRLVHVRIRSGAQSAEGSDGGA